MTCITVNLVLALISSQTDAYSTVLKKLVTRPSFRGILDSSTNVQGVKFIYVQSMLRAAFTPDAKSNRLKS